ncbi:MAG: lipid-A-disaccharide synthase [Pseudomonadota bacterium]
MTAARTCYIIAGEPSGDRLGGALMGALKAAAPFEFHGVGGQDMIAAGLASRFDMGELTVMGISEVLPKLPGLLRRIRETADDVIARRPDVLITIDSPDFTLRVAKRSRRALPDLKVVHYVAPSVWAWRPGRAAKMARHVDHVLALLPFEPPYMHAAGMTCEFVGHPIAGREVPTPEAVAAFRQQLGVEVSHPLLLLAPGSRKGEVRRLMPMFLETMLRLQARCPGLNILCPVAETVETEVRAALDGLAMPTHILAPSVGSDAKHLAFAAADAALCASGTVTLEVAAANTPMVAAYKTTRLTAAIARRLLKINSANLVNLVSGRLVVPERLQEFCSVDALEGDLLPLLTDPAAGDEQRTAFAKVLQAMGRGGPPPEERAATSVLQFLAGNARIPKEEGPGLLPPGPSDRHIGKR